MDDGVIRVRWEGNGSVRYDGKIQDVALRQVVAGGEETAVGSTVELEFGHRVWKAVVVDPAEPIEPPRRKRRKAGKKCASEHRCSYSEIPPPFLPQRDEDRNLKHHNPNQRVLFYQYTEALHHHHH